MASKFSVILPPESKGIKSTCLCNQRVKLSCFSQKTVILCQIWGCFPAPQGPQSLTRMAPVGTKFYLILPPESKGIKSTCLCNQRVKLSCFSQKTVILCQIWGCFPAPQGPQSLTRMAPVGTKFYLILPPESKGIKSTCLCNQRVKLSCFSQKTAILSQIWGCFPAPRAPNT